MGKESQARPRTFCTTERGLGLVFIAKRRPGSLYHGNEVIRVSFYKDHAGCRGRSGLEARGQLGAGSTPGEGQGWS